MRRMALFLMVSAACLFMAGSAFADDINPPPWPRGSEGTTYAMWEFLTPDTIPDEEMNEYGQSELIPYPGWEQEWEQEWGGRIGVWPLSGAIDIHIPNRPEPLPFKDIWIQVTWAEQFPGAVPTVSEQWVNNPPLEADLVGEIVLEPTGYLGPWIHSTYHIHLEPNPDFELIRIEGGIMVDQIVIDTICIPEPSTLALIGGGLIGLIGIVRKRS